MGLRRFISLPVVTVLLVIAFVYNTVVFLVIQPWLNFSTAPGFGNVILLTAFGIMALVSYALAVVRDPGHVPSSYLPDLEDSQIALHEVKRKGGDMRYCQKCGHYKPPRAHHCRVCKRCVLRMDHHCMWINNCVGHNNYKAFFLFLLYVVAACFQSLVIPPPNLLVGHCQIPLLHQAPVWPNVRSVDAPAEIFRFNWSSGVKVLIGGHTMHELGDEVSNHLGQEAPPVSSSDAITSVIKVLCAILLVPVFVAVGVLLAWHVFLLLHNKTTIEYHEGVRARWLAEKAGQLYRHPYDVGVFDNLVTSLGRSVAYWFCPTATSHLGSGLRFRTFYDEALSVP